MSAANAGPQRTPLYDRHVALGARMIDFAGFLMPVQYTSVLAEHRAVRESAGIFDLSHMGELVFTGPDAQANLQFLTTNDVARLEPGQAQYTLLCNERGGVVDDVILYRLEDEAYLMVPNAANIEKDLAWIRARLQGRVSVRDRSRETALIAVQGPKAAAIVAAVAGRDLADIASFHCRKLRFAEGDVLVSRTGYTGEDGFELYLDAQAAPALWDRLLEAGAGQDGRLTPAGLGARDTLRLEARLPLYGNELSEERSPLAAGLAFAVKFDKGEFVGREALLAEQEQGSPMKLVGFEMLERSVPRQGYPIWHGGRAVGEVTSGAFSPTLDRDIGMGYVPSELASPGVEVEIEIRGKLKRARIVKGRFLAGRARGPNA